MKNTKISHKLNIGFALIILIFFVTAGITTWRMEKVTQATARMERSAELLKIASAWQGDVRQNSARPLAGRGLCRWQCHAGFLQGIHGRHLAFHR